MFYSRAHQPGSESRSSHQGALPPSYSQVEPEEEVPYVKYFHVDKQEIQLGHPLRLSWEVIGLEQVVIEPEVGEVTPHGAVDVYPDRDTEYVLKAFHDDELIFEEHLAVFLPMPEIHNFEAAESEITIGYATILYWQIENASQILIDKGVGKVDIHQSFVEAYFEVPGPCTITAINATGKISQTIELTLPLPEIYNFEAGLEIVELGLSNLLLWEVKNATELHIDHGVGEVTGLNKTEVLTDRTTTYSLTAMNHTGSVQKSVTLVLPPPRILFFKPDSELVTDEEREIELSWEVENAYELTINHGVGNVTKRNQVSVRPKEAISVYRLTAKGHSGTDTFEVTLRKFPLPLQEEMFTNLDKEITMSNLDPKKSLQDPDLDVDLDAAMADMKEDLERTIYEFNQEQDQEAVLARDYGNIELTDEMMNLKRPKMRDELAEVYKMLMSFMKNKFNNKKQ